MSFPPGQPWPQQQPQQQQQQQLNPATTNVPNATVLPPPPPPRINNGPPGNPVANMNMNRNGRRNDNRNNPQFNRSRKLNIHLTPLNAYGPSTTGSSPSQAATATDSSSFATRDPRNSNNQTAPTAASTPLIGGGKPNTDPRVKKDDTHPPPNQHGLNAGNDSGPRNRSDPRLKIADVSNNNKVEPNNVPKNDPRFNTNIDKKPIESIKTNDNSRMNPLLAASQKQQQKNHKQNHHNNKKNNHHRKMQDARIPRRQQAQNSQYPTHPSRQQQRVPPPPPPKHKNRYGGGGGGYQQRHHSHHHPQNNMNQYGPQNQNRPVPPPPPPKRIPPPPPGPGPGPGPGRGGAPSYSQQPPQQPGNFRGPPNQMNIQNTMPNNNNIIPPPPPPRRPPNFQGGPGQQPHNNQGQGPRMAGMHNNANHPNRNNNAPFQIPPPPPPPGSGPGRPMHPSQGPGHHGRGFPIPSTPQPQQQPPPGQIPPPGTLPYPNNPQQPQQPATPGQYPPPGIPPAQQHPQAIMDPYRQNHSQVQQQQQQQAQQPNPTPGFPHHGRPPQMHQPPPLQGAVAATSMNPVMAISHVQQQQAQQQIPITPQQPKSPWTEHTAPSGIKYYYNSVTKESTYSKPEDFDGPVAVKPTTAATTSTPSSSQKTTKPTWREYTDKNTGKKYYSDGKTTSWEKPANFIPSMDFQSPNAKKRSSTTLLAEKSKKVKKKSESPKPKKEPTYANKEEAIAAFKGLLLAKGISPSMKWADVFKICSEDYRWSACKTLGERKQALAEYQTKRANEEKEMRRQEIKRAKDAFQQLMTDMLPRLGITPNSRFGECRDKLAKDDRFFAVEDEETREELFYDFVEEMRKREERVNRAKKKAARDAFWSFMKEKEQNGSLTFASTWSSFKSSLDETSLSDPRFAVSACFVDADRQLMFADYVIDLQAAEDEKRRRIRKARLDAEKAQRDAYRVFLRKLAKEGRITIVTRWRNIEEIASKDPTFIPVKEQDDDAPRMIFEDFVDDMKDRYRKDKHFLSRLISPSKVFPTGIVVGKNTEFEEFRNNLLKAAGKEHEVECKKILNREPMSSVKWFFNELHLRAKNAMAAAYGASTSFRRNSSSRMASVRDESEDEGEIVEDGEVTE